MLVIQITFLIALFATASSAIIRDIYGNETQFLAQANQWTVQNFGGTEKISGCGGTLLLGGSPLGSRAASARRVYSDLPTHSTIGLRIQAWFLDSWDALELEKLSIRFDSRTLNDWIVDYRPTDAMSGHPNLCGDPTYGDTYITIYANIVHSLSTLTLDIASNLNEAGTSESWGIREITIIFNPNITWGPIIYTEPRNIKCGVPHYSSITFDQCICQDNQFLLPGGVNCQDCSSQCSSCYGPSIDECYMCSQNAIENGQTCGCLPPQIEYQGTCNNACPLGTYFSNRECVECFENCENCTSTKCITCKPGYRKISPTECYPICEGNKKNAFSKTCNESSFNSPAPNCLVNLGSVADGKSCQIQIGKKVIYEINYDSSQHYSTQTQDNLMMACGNSPPTKKMQDVGDYVATLVMILKKAGLKSINGFDLTSSQVIATSLAPLITDMDCNFVDIEIQKSAEFPFVLLGSFPLMLKDMDFSTLTLENLNRIYDRSFVEKAIGNLVVCGNACSAMLVWRRTNPGQNIITQHSTMLIRLETLTSTGSIEEIYNNAIITFADPESSADQSFRKREKNTFCFEEPTAKGTRRSCMAKIIIYRHK